MFRLGHIPDVMDLAEFHSNETMRLYPPVSDGSQRIVPYGSGGRVIDNKYV